MNWLQPDKLRELYNTAQTGAQIVNQFRQFAANAQGENSTLVRTQNELTFASTSTTRNSDSSSSNGRETNQNLHDGFSKEVNPILSLAFH